METYSKLDEMRLEEKCELKKYFTYMTMEEARTHFRIRTNTISCKLNQSSDTSWKSRDQVEKNTFLTKLKQ